MSQYTASLSKDAGRKAYSMSFRHPLRRDPKTKYGIKVRRGLGTDDKDEALALVAQMNAILGDPLWHNIDRRQQAGERFDKRIVDAFYDAYDTVAMNHISYMDTVLPIPSKADGYGIAMFIGPSGAGKTSLLRILMGTGASNYPTTATGRTSTYELEVICDSDNMYELVVSFMQRDDVVACIMECVQDAVAQYVEKSKRSERKIELSDVVERFLTHRDLTVRLAYILGHPSMRQMDLDDEADVEFKDSENESIIDEGTLNTILQKVNGYIEKIIALANAYLSSELAYDELIDDEEGAVNSLETYLVKSDMFFDLVHDIVDEIELRFSLLFGGKILSDTRGWVNVWSYQTEDEEEFIKVAKLLSSNHKAYWGRLLTPIVKHMRVKGPFKPNFMPDATKMIYIDGLGLGHNVTASSIPTSITSKFNNVDAILLVDSGKNPLLDNTKLAIKTVIESGNSYKMFICFTHMDTLRGGNLQTKADKRNHVKAPLEAYLLSLRDQRPPVVDTETMNHILQHCSFLWNLHSDVKPGTQEEIAELVGRVHYLAMNNEMTTEARLKYDVAMLVPYVQTATKDFRTQWRTTLGLPNRTNQAEHWSRIKALSRRLCYFNEDHYQSLMPIADLLRQITAQLNIYISNPLPNSYGYSERSKRERMDSIKRRVYSDMHIFVAETLWRKDYKNVKMGWFTAFNYSGRGSTYQRANEIDRIFQDGAPEFDKYDPILTPAHGIFMGQIIKVVLNAIDAEDGELSTMGYPLSPKAIVPK